MQSRLRRSAAGVLCARIDRTESAIIPVGNTSADLRRRNVVAWNCRHITQLRLRPAKRCLDGIGIRRQCKAPAHRYHSSNESNILVFYSRKHYADLLKY